MKNQSVRRVVTIAAGMLGIAIIVTLATWHDLPEWFLWTATGLLMLIGFAPPVMSLLGGPRRSAFRNGELALGTLRRLRQTGVQFNDQPQLELFFDVETADGRRFDGRARQVVSLTDLPGLVPGAVLPVRYLPDRTDGWVMIAGDTAPEQLEDLLLRRQLALGRITPRQFEAAQHGVGARAVVLTMRPTGEVQGDLAVIELQLRVTRPDGTRFDTTVRKALPAIALPGLQPGAVVGVKYLPSDEGDVLVQARTH